MSMRPFSMRMLCTENRLFEPSSGLLRISSITSDQLRRVPSSRTTFTVGSTSFTSCTTMPPRNSDSASTLAYSDVKLAAVAPPSGSSILKPRTSAESAYGLIEIPSIVTLRCSCSESFSSAIDLTSGGATRKPATPTTATIPAPHSAHLSGRRAALGCCSISASFLFCPSPRPNPVRAFIYRPSLAGRSEPENGIVRPVCARTRGGLSCGPVPAPSSP